VNQELTLSHKAIKFLYSNKPTYRSDKSIKFVDIIEQNYLVTDDLLNHFCRLEDALSTLPNDDIRKQISELLYKWMLDKRKEVHIDKKITELELAKLSGDKIYIDPTLNGDRLQELKSILRSIEVHNYRTMISPGHKHRLKNVPDSYALADRKKYSVKLLLGPYLRNTKNIIIRDPFLPNVRAHHNLKKILSLCPKSSKIKLQLLSKEMYLMHNRSKKKIEDYEEFESTVKDYRKNGLKIVLDCNYFIDKKHTERFLFTDKLEIYIPGGLDCIDDQGFYKSYQNRKSKEKKAEIRVNYRKYK